MRPRDASIQREELYLLSEARSGSRLSPPLFRSPQRSATAAAALAYSGARQVAPPASAFSPLYADGLPPPRAAYHAAPHASPTRCSPPGLLTPESYGAIAARNFAVMDAAKDTTLSNPSQEPAIALRSAAADAAQAALDGWERAQRELDRAREQIWKLEDERRPMSRCPASPVLPDARSVASPAPPQPLHPDVWSSPPQPIQAPPRPSVTADALAVLRSQPPIADPLKERTSDGIPTAAAMFAALDEHRHRASQIVKGLGKEKPKKLPRPAYLRQEGGVCELFLDSSSLAAAAAPEALADPESPKSPGGEETGGEKREKKKPSSPKEKDKGAKKDSK
eukprot:TRINITY_DN24338_c0_g1_i2.p1 TRINITY_DN24338_c0_g1~~TRINITY_DN24338_c0_g1_i2.p1  ORF type:complete len:337 (+),score=107.48 TRINITY_DN24338_c0_g1_i2:51-1061(+)